MNGASRTWSWLVRSGASMASVPADGATFRVELLLGT